MCLNSLFYSSITFKPFSSNKYNMQWVVIRPAFIVLFQFPSMFFRTVLLFFFWSISRSFSFRMLFFSAVVLFFFIHFCSFFVVVAVVVQRFSTVFSLQCFFFSSFCFFGCGLFSKLFLKPFTFTF